MLLFLQQLTEAGIATNAFYLHAALHVCMLHIHQWVHYVFNNVLLTKSATLLYHIEIMGKAIKAGVSDRVNSASVVQHHITLLRIDWEHDSTPDSC